MKYKIGNEVRVKHSLRNDVEYYMEGRFKFDKATTDMLGYRGKKVTIAQYAAGKYKIEGSYRFWTDEMFEEKKRFNGLEV